VVVVSMSAARQAIAIGILFWITAEWERAAILRRIAFILLASCFHISALIFLPFVGIGLKMRLWPKILFVAVFFSVLLVAIEFSGYADHYDKLYLTAQVDQVHSPGALMHVLINAFPGALALLLNRRTGGRLLPDSLHRNMAVAALLLLPMVFISSTSAGRLTLYLFPVSMWFFSALPGALKTGVGRDIARFSTSILFFIVLVVWLNFANNASAYQAYQNALLVPQGELILCCRRGG